MWPPPAPPEYIDRAQLPANLPPSSVAIRPHVDHKDDNSDNVSEAGGPAGAAGAQVMRQRSAGSEAGPRTSTDHAETSEHASSQRGEFHASGETDKLVKRQVSDVPHEPGHQLKRTSSDDHEPGMQLKRLSDATGHVGSGAVASTTSSHGVIGGDRGEPGTRHRHDLDPQPRNLDPEIPSTVSGEKIESRSSGERHLEPTSSVPPRLMDQGRGDEPMVIEFSSAAGGGGFGSGDEESVRAGHKRARINSDTVHNDVIRQSFVKRPITFYGKFTYIFVTLLCKVIQHLTVM